MPYKITLNQQQYNDFQDLLEFVSDRACSDAYRTEGITKELQDFYLNLNDLTAVLDDLTVKVDFNGNPVIPEPVI